MAELHNGVLNKLYGKLRTDKEYNLELRRIMEIINSGVNIQYYTDKFNRIMVKRGGIWWVMKDLAKLDEFYEVSS